MEHQIQVETLLSHLFAEAKKDRFKVLKGFAKSVLKGIQPADFKEAYLSISKEQGEDLKELIVANKLRNIVEFGTSFGISTLYLAQGAAETNGHVISTELIESKALAARENFKKAGLNDRIEVRIGDAMETLENHKESIDLLLLDGWKDLYLPLFQMLELNFHGKTQIYVDNADMSETKAFLEVIRRNTNYKMEAKFGGKVVLITVNDIN
ncbi:MAG: class I SAM-dependent methyltransferase [Bacteroidetes bacterium]|nr:class I SAM-dependent methyltransferase [Bacteroidota bacterium]